MRVVMLVPRRADQGRRDLLWQWVQHRWETVHADIPIVVGTDDGPGPFNRSAAINRAAAGAGDWDVAVIGDADTFVDRSQVYDAVASAAATGQMTMAFDRWCALGPTMTARVMAGYDGDWWPGVLASMTGTCSSMFAIGRQLWDQIGGFDPGFHGWGAEDIAFAHAARTFGGGWVQIGGDCWHLYHDSSPRPHLDANVARADRYHAAAGDPAAMRALLDELVPA